MIHARKDYQRIQDPANKIPEHEPVFLLRGQDMLAPATMAFWVLQYRMKGGDPEVIKMVEGHIAAVLDFQSHNGNKLADVPNLTDHPVKPPKYMKNRVRRNNLMFGFPVEL